MFLPAGQHKLYFPTKALITTGLLETLDGGPLRLSWAPAALLTEQPGFLYRLWLAPVVSSLGLTIAGITVRWIMPTVVGFDSHEKRWKWSKWEKNGKRHLSWHEAAYPDSQYFRGPSVWLPTLALLPRPAGLGAHLLLVMTIWHVWDEPLNQPNYFSSKYIVFSLSVFQKLQKPLYMSLFHFPFSFSYLTAPYIG